jgi:probable rRNA maturation factor
MKVFIHVHPKLKDKILNFTKIEKVLGDFFKKNPRLNKVMEINVNLTLCGPTKIKSLNREYRQIDKVTDVLSFGLYDDLRFDSKSIEKPLPIIDLGDIFVCTSVAKKQALKFDITFEMELVHLFTHGCLHLLGYDHEISKAEALVMEKLESEVVKKIYKAIGFEK